MDSQQIRAVALSGLMALWLVAGAGVIGVSGATDVQADDTDSVDVQSADIPTYTFGDSFRTQDDQIITIGEPELTDSYTYEDFRGETQTDTAPSGEQFAFIQITVENDAGEPRQTPNILSFEIVTSDSQHGPLWSTDYRGDDRYDGLNENLDGVVEEGVIAYTVDEDATDDELRLFFNDFSEQAIWEQPEPEPALDEYANENGIVDTNGLRAAIEDWRANDIDTSVLRDVIEAWRSSEPIV